MLDLVATEQNHPAGIFRVDAARRQEVEGGLPDSICQVVIYVDHLLRIQLDSVVLNHSLDSGGNVLQVEVVFLHYGSCEAAVDDVDEPLGIGHAVAFCSISLEASATAFTALSA